MFPHQTGFKKLQSLEICGGGLTDAGVKNIQGLISLRRLNLSQNCNLTDKTLELISGIFYLSFLFWENLLSCMQKDKKGFEVKTPLLDWT